MSKPPVVRANITFLLPESGGRARLPDFGSGKYAPHLVVQDPDVRHPNLKGKLVDEPYLGVRFISGVGSEQLHLPAEYLLEFMYWPEVNYDALCEGATFTIREGPHVIGYGRVIERIDAIEERR
jgi:hypothetical protein